MKTLPNNKAGHVFRPTKRLLGQILIDGNFVSPRKLEAALARQQETNEQLGGILLSMGELKPSDLKAVLFVQRELASLEDSIKAAAGVREVFSEYLLKAKKITPVQRDPALDSVSNNSNFSCLRGSGTSSNKRIY